MVLAVAHPWASASSYLSKERKREENSTPARCVHTVVGPVMRERKKERKKTDNPREGWENGTPPPHRDFKERSVMRERVLE